MINYKNKLIGLITTIILITGLITPVEIVKSDEVIYEGANSEKPNKVIEIISFNDFHGSVLEGEKNVGAAKLTGIIKEYKEKAEESDIYDVVIVSGGDMYQGASISNILEGEPVTAMLKEIGIVASAIGNHEYDWGVDKIKPWAEEVGFKFLAANIVNKTTGLSPDYVEPYIIKNIDGINVAFIGIATPSTLTSTKAKSVEDLKFLDTIKTLDKYSKIVRDKGADIIIALTHLESLEENDGTIIGEATDIAKNCLYIDAVISAHSHKFVDGFVKNNNSGKDVPIVQAGYNGRGLSVITFTFNEDKEVLKVEANTREFYKESQINKFPVDENVRQIILKYNEELSPKLLTKITELKFDLGHDRYSGLTPLGITVAEAIRKASKAEVAIINFGGVRAPLTKGTITLGDIYKILPFDNNVVSMKVKGSKLKELIKQGIYPNGSRWGQYSGITVWYNPKTKEITSMKLSDGSKIKDDEYYTLASIDFLMTGGDGYNFDGVIDSKVVGEMRDIVIKEWSNGIEKLDYNLLIEDEK